MTDLEKLKACYDDLGIEYHEVKNASGYTYMRKVYAHEVKNKQVYNSFIIGTRPLTNESDLGKFFEFDDTGKLVSW